MTTRGRNPFNSRAVHHPAPAALLRRQGDGETGRRGQFPSRNPQPSTLNPNYLSTLNPQPSTRAGFTLIELMVVITIISILVTLTTVAGFAFVNNAKQAATATTIAKVDEAILERVNGLNRWNEQSFTRLNNQWEQRGWLRQWELLPVLDPGGTPLDPTNNPDQQVIMRVLSRKYMMKEMFPITQSELRQCFWFWGKFDGLDPKAGISNSAELDAMNAFLADMDLDATNGAQSLDRPGEIFLYCLKNAPVYGGLPMVEDDFLASELIDLPGDDTQVSDNDGVPELADSWGNPLRFYRWPTRLVNNGEGVADEWSNNPGVGALMPNAPFSPPGTVPQKDSLKRDPDDPARRLAGYTIGGVSARTYFHDPFTWHAPLVVSAGPDGELGLAEPDASIPNGTINRYGLAEPLNNEQLFDNLTNHTSDGSL